MQAINDRVQIELNLEKDKQVGKIIIAEAARGRPREGKVISVGPGKANASGFIVPTQVVPGQTVFFSITPNYTEVIYDGNKLVFIRESDIIAVYK